jgi:D-sedoheptulose 7-phosphate isomerase
MSFSDPSSVFRQAIDEHLAVIDSLKDQESVLQMIAEEMARAIFAGHKVLWCGNGGSAADSQHLAAELMGRFRKQRRKKRYRRWVNHRYVHTTPSNDYGFERISPTASRGTLRGDVLGVSRRRVRRRMYTPPQTARQIGARTIAFTGQGDLHHRNCR